ncbi:MAG: hypothetical protein COB67_05455 [SAR324 cluster bacterium]|uniref:Uncharacterized protein n=1 Tax=SAR324 cluster bacterium TaxID=2024889 RepID=A0A2A4T5Q1_9DELT|nr:MAG: hypothetical protein COB67_05455 [SAR324 cluster bacterium]
MWRLYLYLLLAMTVGLLPTHTGLWAKTITIKNSPFIVLAEIPLIDEEAENDDFLVTRLTVGKKGNLYVLSAWSYKVKTFNAQGEFIGEIDFEKDIPFVHPPLRAPKPGELAVNSVGYLFISAYWIDSQGDLQSGVFIFSNKGKFEHIINLEQIDVEDMVINDLDQILLTGIDMKTGEPREFLWQINQSGKTMMSYFTFSNPEYHYWEQKSNNMKDRFLVGNFNENVQLITTLPGSSTYSHITSRLNMIHMSQGIITDRKIFVLPLWVQSRSPSELERTPDQVIDGIISIIQLRGGQLLVQRTHNDLYYNTAPHITVSLKPHLYLHILSASGKPIQPNISTGGNSLNLGILRSRDQMDNLYFVRLNDINQTIITKVALKL